MAGMVRGWGGHVHAAVEQTLENVVLQVHRLWAVSPTLNARTFSNNSAARTVRWTSSDKPGLRPPTRSRAQATASVNQGAFADEFVPKSRLGRVLS